MKRIFWFSGLALPLMVLGGCNPTVTIHQDKPIEVNINFKGHLDLVVHEAQDNLAEIKGAKPRNAVNLEDIGISGPTTSPGAAISDPFPTFAALARRPAASPDTRNTFPIAAADDLKTAMHARDGAVQAMWDGGLVGESHDGMLVAKGKLSADQEQTLAAENADRTKLYALEAQQKGTPAADIALGYYVARLGYAKKGAWFEKKNAAGQWEWQQWAK